MWNKLSLRLKFLSLVIPLAIFTTFIFYVFVERQLSEDDNETLIGRIAELAEVQSRSISGPLWSFNIQQLQLVASSMINDPDVVGVDVLDETGASVASEGILDEASDEVFLEERAVFFNTNGTSREIGKLRVYYSKERLIDQAVARRLVALIATSLLICGLIFSALVGLYYTVLIPLGRFGEAIEKTRSSNIAVPVNWDTSDEMGTVARAFNDLQVQQKSDEAALRRIQDNLEDLVEKRTETLAQRETQLVRARDEAQGALEQLKRTQDRLIQSQKMASLGQLSAGIAHEIKNPLNFVNNFSVMSVEMLGELQEALRKFREAPSEELAGEIAELTEILEGNLEKIDRHGRRADNIVRNMLLHSREGPANFRLISVNQIVAEAVNLAFSQCPRRVRQIQRHDRGQSSKGSPRDDVCATGLVACLYQSRQQRHVRNQSTRQEGRRRL